MLKGVKSTSVFSYLLYFTHFSFLIIVCIFYFSNNYQVLYSNFIYFSDNLCYYQNISFIVLRSDTLRKKIYQIIESPIDSDNKSKIYDFFMMFVITVSLIPLAFKETSYFFNLIDKVSLSIFIIDYILRFITADFKYGNKSIKSFVKYPFSTMAIIDLLTILPSVTAVNSSFRILRIVRLLRTFKVFRAFKLFRYSKNIQIIRNVIIKSKNALLTVCILSFGYVIVCALIIFNVEPSSFQNFFEAVYWATVSLTTMGYGDIYPVTTLGRLITMLSSLVGIAIIALPSGIITAGYMDELNNIKNNNN